MLAVSTGVTFEGNLAFGCETGFRVQDQGGGNLIIGNRAFDNTGDNLLVAQGNALGLPIDVTDPQSFLGLCNAEDLSNFVR